nr:MAG TPA: hypothetical protein [Caudoviricetes sp.]
MPDIKKRVCSAHAALTHRKSAMLMHSAEILIFVKRRERTEFLHKGIVSVHCVGRRAVSDTSRLELLVECYVCHCKVPEIINFLFLRNHFGIHFLYVFRCFIGNSYIVSGFIVKNHIVANDFPSFRICHISPTPSLIQPILRGKAVSL